MPQSFESHRKSYLRGLERLRKKQKYLRVKRIVDVLGAASALILISPLIGMAAVAIMASSGLPVMFNGRRAGFADKDFVCYKLRTMSVEQDRIVQQRKLQVLGNESRLLIYKSDPRINRVGQLLRKFSIDELPQLLNVLKGEMSLVGPRALPLAMLADYPEYRLMRGCVRPGISGLWQVTHRQKNVSVIDMIEDDLSYVASIGMMSDLTIMLRTLSSIVEPEIGEASN